MVEKDLVGAIGSALAELQAAYEDRDDALARRLGAARSDLRCLDLITRHGPQTPAMIATRLHLTPGSVTALLDRLEHAGQARRVPHPDHGRKLLVVPTADLAAGVLPLAEHARAAGEDLAGYTSAELTLILGFLDTVRSRQQSLTAALRTDPAVAPPLTEPEHRRTP